jgi:hypothetical protein
VPTVPFPARVLPKVNEDLLRRASTAVPFAPPAMMPGTTLVPPMSFQSPMPYPGDMGGGGGGGPEEYFPDEGGQEEFPDDMPNEMDDGQYFSDEPPAQEGEDEIPPDMDEGGPFPGEGMTEGSMPTGQVSQ